MSAAASRRVFGPFNRVEGDLEVDVEIRNGLVSKAWVNSPLFRGFEQILHGKDPRDALVYTPRICGICSVAQSVAAARAIGTAQKISLAENGRLSTNIILACENMADHLTHFYLFFMPDFARSCYKQQAWHELVAERFRAQSGTCVNSMLPARAGFLHITGILAGKWPHTLAIQAGGTTRSVESQERIRLLAIIGAFRQFLESVLFGDQLENLAALSSPSELETWADDHTNSDFGIFLKISRQLKLDRIGKARDSFMSFGSYELEQGHLFKSGVWFKRLQSLQQSKITEDVSSSWLQAQNSAHHPYEGSTIPDSDFSRGYSWCKAPRYDDRIVEVGALARQQVNGHPLIRALVADSGSNVRNRVIARLLELALVVPQMQVWTKSLKPREPFCTQANMPDESRGAGLIEAARGSLGHWLRIKHGRILNYQIIAPTTWNFSPRDSRGTPGALEQALEGTEIGRDGNDHVMIQHIVRSFDPCMVCTVH